MMRNSVVSETELIDAIIKEIGERLPPRWVLRVRGRNGVAPSQYGAALRVDAVLEITEPRGTSSEILVEVKARPAEPSLLANVMSRLKASSRCRHEELGKSGPEPVMMLIAPYLSPLTRERLTESGVSYADATGNISLTVERPAVFIQTQGADKNPIREERPLRSLKGGRAARVVRALMDYRTPFGTRELAAETGSSPAMVSRVVNLLEPDEIVTKAGRRGRIVSVDWEMLASRWAEDYAFASSNALTTWLEPRGASTLFGRLRGAEFRYAVTGSFAAYRLAPAAKPRLVTLYVDDPGAAARALALRPADAGGNVLLASPFDPVAL